MADTNNLAASLPDDVNDDFAPAGTSDAGITDAGAQAQAPDAAAAPADNSPSPNAPAPPAPQDMTPPDIQTPPPSGNALANVLPPPATPDMPRFRRTVGNTLKGALIGLVTGGVGGAVYGAADPRGIQKVAADRWTQEQAKTTFATAQAAHMVAQAAMADKQYQNFDQDHQQLFEKQSLDNLKAAQQAGFVVRAVSPLDKGTEENTKAAMNNLNGIVQSDGAVGTMLHLHVGDKMISLQMSDPTAGLDTINNARKAQGLPLMDGAIFQKMSPEAQAKMGIDAINFTNPTNASGQMDESSLQTAQNRLALVQQQPEFQGKEDLVNKLQANVKLQGDILDRAKTRANQQEAQEIQSKGVATAATPQGAAQLNLTKAQTGEANAAAAKSRAEAAAVGETPIYAYDPKTKQTIQTTPSEAKAQGYTNPVKVTEQVIQKDRAANMQLNDVQLNISRYQAALGKLQDRQDRLKIAAVINDGGLSLGAHAYGASVSLPTDWFNRVTNSANFGRLTPEEQDAVIGYYRARASVPAFVKAVTDTGRSNKEVMDMELQSIPDPTLPKDVAAKQMTAFQENIDQVGKSRPIIVGVDSHSQVKQQIEQQQQQEAQQKAQAEAQAKQAQIEAQRKAATHQGFPTFTVPQPIKVYDPNSGKIQ